MHKIYNITPCQSESGLLFLLFLQKIYSPVSNSPDHWKRHPEAR